MYMFTYIHVCTVCIYDIHDHCIVDHTGIVFLCFWNISGTKFQRNGSSQVLLGFRSWVLDNISMCWHELPRHLNRHEKANRNAVAVARFGRFSRTFPLGTCCHEAAKVLHGHSRQGSWGSRAWPLDFEDAYYGGLRWGDTVGATSENGASTQQIHGPLQTWRRAMQMFSPIFFVQMFNLRCCVCVCVWLIWLLFARSSTMVAWRVPLIVSIY